ncbi:MAG TPA: DUF3667 domain-containing protein [Longimicrobium sp.]|jgi:hypothetical protein
MSQTPALQIPVSADPAASLVQESPRQAVPLAAECVSCGAMLTGAYCQACGQKAMGRFTFPNILQHLVTDALDLNKGLLFTAWSLLRDPGRVVRDYVAGRTVRYTNPVKYLLIVVTLVVLVYVQMGALDAMMAALKPGTDPSAELAKNPMGSWMVGHLNVMMLVGLPFLAVASWLVFRRARLNYAEHLIFNLYVYAQQSLMSLLLVTPLFAAGQVVPGIVVQCLITLGYYAWAASGFFQMRPLPAFLRTLGAQIVGGLLSAVAGGIIGAAVALSKLL